VAREAVPEISLMQMDILFHFLKSFIKFVFSRLTSAQRSKRVKGRQNRGVLRRYFFTLPGES
jgi:hypothetical protein